MVLYNCRGKLENSSEFYIHKEICQCIKQSSQEFLKQSRKEKSVLHMIDRLRARPACLNPIRLLVKLMGHTRTEEPLKEGQNMLSVAEVFRRRAGLESTERESIL